MSDVIDLEAERERRERALAEAVFDQLHPDIADAMRGPWRPATLEEMVADGEAYIAEVRREGFRVVPGGKK